MNNAPTECPDCGSPIKHIPAGYSKKTKKPYNEFWACENPECKYTYSEKGTKLKPVPRQESFIFLLEELQDFRKEINERLDNMGAWLAKKFNKNDKED